MFWNELLGVLKGLLGIAGPLIEEHIAQQYDGEQKAKLAEWQSILSIPNEDARAGAINRFISELCVDAGTPSTGLSTNISVPLPHFNALVIIATGKIKDDKVIGSLIFSLRKS